MGKILFVSPSAYPLGGVATWLDYIVPGLKNLGWSVTVGLVSGIWHDVTKYCETHTTINPLRINNPTGSRVGRQKAILNAMRTVKPDIVVSINIPDMFQACAMYEQKYGKVVKTVMTIHGIQPDFYEDARLNSNVIDAVICTNKLACKLAQKDGNIDSEKVFYASYGVKYDEEFDGVNPKEGISNIVYVGRFEKWQKRIQDVLRIMDLLKDKTGHYQFIFAGGGKDERELVDYICRETGNTTIELLGNISPKDIESKVYARADAILVTSLWETGPIVIWEAMANGVPVISSEYVGSGLEGGLVDGENCLMFPVGDVQAAVNCIRKLADTDLRRRLVENARKLVKMRYTLDESIRRWNDCFIKVKKIEKSINQHNTSQKPHLSGRLDRIFGLENAESIRWALGRRYIHSSAGSEWPHSYGQRLTNDKAFWQMARECDRVTSKNEC